MRHAFRIGLLSAALLAAGFLAPAAAQELSAGISIGLSKRFDAATFGVHYSKAKSGKVSVGVGYHPQPRVWVPGHYEVVEKQVWVPGKLEKVWIEPLFRTGYDSCGKPVKICIREGYWKVVEHPGRFECRSERVWVPGAWKPAGSCPPSYH